jgi:RAQPRD family integrative conjugative element protein
MKILWPMLLALLIILVAPPAMADADSERANLAKLVGELNFLMERVDAIAVDAPQSQPYFRYDLLKKDIQSIRVGIETYFDRRLSVARDIQPLRAHYIATDEEH